MNRKELIEKVSEVLNSQKDAKAAIDCMIQTITNALVNGDKVMLAGFGIFKTVERAQSTARNLHTGEKIIVPAHTSIKFSPGKLLKDVVRKENRP